MYILNFVHTRVLMLIYTCTHSSALHTHVHTYTHACTHTHTRTCTHAYTHTHACTHARIHTHLHAHAHNNAHISHTHTGFTTSLLPSCHGRLSFQAIA